MSEDKDDKIQLVENAVKTADVRIDTAADANEFLMEMDGGQFDQTLEIMSQTLASIDDKIDVKNSQLQKLDQLSGIKEQLNRLESNSITTKAEGIPYDLQITEETISETEEKTQQSSSGHNQKEIYKLLEKINILEKKIQTIENQSNYSNEKIENVIKKFENLESELPNLIKKKEPNKESSNINKLETQSDATQLTIPKNTSNVIEEVEGSLENTNNETLILDDFKEKKSKSNILKYIFNIFLFLAIITVVLFFLNKLQIINLNFDEVINSADSFINLILTKALFYFN